MKWSPALLALLIPGLARPAPDPGGAAEPAPSPILGIAGKPLPESAADAAGAAKPSGPTDPAQRALARLARAAPPVMVDFNLPTIDGIHTIAPKEVVSETDIDSRIEQIKASEAIRQARDLKKLGGATDAIKLLETTLASTRSESALVDLNHQLGVLFYQAGDHENAASHLEKVQEKRPDDFKVASNLAAILISIVEVDRAFISLEKIDTKQLVRENAKELLFKVHFNYACGYSLRKKSEEALAHLELAARFGPRDVLSSIGDPNLDHVRKEPRFVQLREELEGVLGLERVSP